MRDIFYDVNANGSTNMTTFVILKCHGFSRDLWSNGHTFFRNKNKCHMLLHELFRASFFGNSLEAVIQNEMSMK